MGVEPGGTIGLFDQEMNEIDEFVVEKSSRLQTLDQKYLMY